MNGYNMTNQLYQEGKLSDEDFMGNYVLGIR